jgi:hypothetical protein
MDEIRLRVRSVSELVDAAFALYRRDASQYIMVMAVASIPQLVIQLLGKRDASSFGFSTLVFTLITGLVSAFTITAASAAITKFGSEVYLNDRADLSAALRSVIPKIMPILVAGFAKLILYLIGFLCFFVGALYVAARFFAVNSAIVLEDAAVGEAFSRSSQLSDSRKRHILNTLLLVWIIYFLLSVCITVVTTLMHSPVLTIIGATVFSIVAYPIVALTGMLLYYDCRIRGEGFDIEWMASSMARADTPGNAGTAGSATFS